MVLGYQSSRDFLRWIPHFHCIVLEGGFDENGKFVHIRLGNLYRMSEYFRRVIIKFFNANLATNLIIPAFSAKAFEALSQYIARPPIPRTFSAMRFLLQLTQHIAPKGCQYIRRYGLYASRTKGKWPEMPYVVRLAPTGWKKDHLQAAESVHPYHEESACPVSDKESRSTWAKLIAQVYEVDPLACSRCASPMKVIAVST